MVDPEVAAAPASRPKPKGRQAVVVIHGMGEQVPMDTLRGFVDATWVHNDSLIRRDRPDTNTGESPRERNPVWSKPDDRNHSFELRRIATEKPEEGNRTDFYEFYWAHLMHGTTWEQFKAWISDLLLRSPRRVPRDVYAAWIALWIITVIGAVIAAFSLLPVNDLRQCFAGRCFPTTCDPSKLCWTWLKPIVGGVVTLLLGTFVNVFLLKYFGDVARYVKATPLNVARRQEIREKGVELLETLMGVRGFDVSKHPKGQPLPAWDTEYDRIIVVAHSLGTIVAYDILKHSFGRINTCLNVNEKATQPHRDALETLLRTNLANGRPLDLNAFRKLQKDCQEELIAQGNPWIVSDFVTLGSPLTHAEFLLSYDEADMRAQQQERILPTCPPTLEWSRTTERYHFSFWPGGRRLKDKDKDNDAESALFRYPHHAAHFAFTRWTNIYSKSKAILWGDQISGPLADQFDLHMPPFGSLAGIRDIAVLPERDPNGEPKGKVPFFTHTKYWDEQVNTGGSDATGTPFHIRTLREAIDLLDRN